MGDSLTRYHPRAATEHHDLLRRACASPAKAGYLVILTFAAVFIGWGGFVPLAGGALAPGVIAPYGSRKTVQHLEGGIISRLEVREGDRVTAGQTLLVLEDVQMRAQHKILTTQRLRLLSRHARLETERSAEGSITFPDEVQNAGPEGEAVMRSQARLFETRGASMRAREDVLKRRLEQLAHQIGGLQAQSSGTKRQLALVKVEEEGKSSLMRRGLIAKPEALRLQRMVADLEARQGEIDAGIARSEQQVAETKMQLLQLTADRIDQIADESDKLRLELAEVDQKLKGVDDVLRRAVVVAPVSGRIVNMKFKTIGGIVQRGEPILDVVPDDDALVIEAKVNPIDVNGVQVGQKALVHLATNASRTMPRLFGVVRSLSADRVGDTTTRQGHYVARVEIDRNDLLSTTGIELIPGMMADVLIVAKERPFLDYLLQPFSDSLRRSLRET